MCLKRDIVKRRKESPENSIKLCGGQAARAGKEAERKMEVIKRSRARKEER